MNRTRKRRKDRLFGLHLLWMVPVVVAAVASTVSPPTPVEALQQVPDSVVIDIEATCRPPSGLGRVTIDPFSAYVDFNSLTGNTDRNPLFAWVLSNNSGPNVDSIAIQPDDQGRWPFGNARQRGRRGRVDAARERIMNRVPRRGGNGRRRAIRRNERFKYNVVVYCSFGDTLSYEVSIDPDIEIGG